MRAPTPLILAAAALGLAACGGRDIEPVAAAEPSPETAAAIQAITNAKPYALPPADPATDGDAALAPLDELPDDARASD